MFKKKTRILLLIIILLIIAFLSSLVLIWRINITPLKTLENMKQNSPLLAVKSDIIEIYDSNNQEVLIFYQSVNDELCFRLLKKNLFGYEPMFGGVVNKENENYYGGVTFENPTKKYTMLMCILNDKNIEEIKLGTHKATIIQKDGIKFWYLLLRDSNEDINNVEFKYGI